MRFSIIVVCLNPGDKLIKTLKSILSQSFEDFEVIVKDGESRDGSMEAMRKNPEFSRDSRIRLVVEKDTSIYDAMNQAVSYADGEFLIFMNCGDFFPDTGVLEEVDRRIKETVQENAVDAGNLILYGNTYSEKNNVVISSPPRITGFTCYRNIPCHQSCVYAARLCREKPYDLQYRIRADYDHFLWCYYVAKAKILAMNVTMASYEGGGFSESKKNRKQDREEHRQITAVYMSREELLHYRLIMFCTLAPLRRFLAENPVFSGIYHGMKERLYRIKK